MTRPVCPSITVIIATYTRAALLDECLRHLARQQFHPGDDVIVVDNGSTDDTREVVRRHQRDYPATLRLLYEAQPGKSHALACALDHARGDILVFTDDDVNAEPGWLDRIRTAMADREVALMGGRVLPRWEASVPAWIRRAPAEHARLGAPLGLLEYPPHVVDLGPRTVLGANLAVRRDVLLGAGGFATHLGKLRGTLLSGEDHELCLRIQRLGFRAVYVAAAVVTHWVPANRAQVRYFLNWFYWSGITNAIVDAGLPGRVSGRSIGGFPLYLLRRGATAAAGVVAALATGRRTTALDRALDVAFAAGYAAQQWGLTARGLGTPKHVTREAA
jgi:glycosyltransferase involved in cell wall biosynthesis